VVVAQRADTLRRPTLSVCRAALIPIQDRGDSRIWFDSRQHANDLHHVIVGDISMPTGANLLELYLRVIPALPMQYEAYCLTFTCGDDLFQSDTKESFLVLRQTLRIFPQSGEIPPERLQFPFLDVGEWPLATSLQRHEFSFKLCFCGQRLIPTAFEFCRYEPIRRVYRVILAPGARHFISRVFQRQRLLLDPIVAYPLQRLDRLNRRFDT